MALQVTSGGGAVAPVVPVEPVSQPAAQGTLAPAPQYQLSFAGLTRASAMGLSSPSGVGDIEIMFAQIADALKDVLDVSDTTDKLGRSESRRGQIGQAMAGFDQMVRWGGEIDSNRANIKTQDGILVTERGNRTAKQTELNGYIAGWTNLRDARDVQSNAVTNFNSLIGQLDARDSALRTEYAKLKSPADNARMAAINSELTVIGGTRAGYVQSRDAAQSQVNTLTGQMAVVDGQINTARVELGVIDGKITAAENSKSASQNRVATLLTTAANFFSNIVSLLSMALGGIKSEGARAAGEVEVEGQGFEAILARMASALVDLGAAMTEGQVGAGLAVSTDGSGLNLEQSQPDRFGAPSAPVARAMAFAGMVAGVMGAVADMLRGLSAGMGMQSAGSFATEGASRVRVPL